MADKAAKAYRTISEAGSETGLPAHVLRFWESKFSQLRPVKRAGGRRLYRPQDISIILGLKHLLYEEGFTIKGAQKFVKEHGVAHLIAHMEAGKGASVLPAPTSTAVDASSDVSAAPLFDSVVVPHAESAVTATQLTRAVHKLNEAKAALASVRKSAPR